MSLRLALFSRPLSPSAHAGRRPGEALLRDLVDQHHDAVHRSLRRLGVPEAHLDDAVQQVFLVVSRRLDEIDVPRARGFLLGIALRVAADTRRTLRRRREDVVAEPEGGRADEPLTPHDLLEEKQARVVLARLLDALPDDLREAFVLFELEEIPGREIAELLGVPHGTVASRVRRAREQIRNALKGGGT
jgi:RNA polymerase sigma-70 factor (ECF subfamily)